MPGSVPRRTGAADTTMGATATAKKDRVERYMFCQVQIMLVAKNMLISLL